ncbi:expressed unknown protein [Ectocarpus siliculosus]|uniref:Wntless-like transmembrane domain-containing protein n=1 Tax=Ectocarpus siliculosus TaxID=2880 RepID=D8LKL5_ECTSI|nr:expressed unknown protein [Ectocarpus siliculosus]|eukprot:CBN74605.1 expressed unknown protein [Ectocarpus siliculosus]
MYNDRNLWDENPGNLWQEKGLMSTLRTWTGLVAVGYTLGLLACLAAGVTGPGLFTSKNAVFSTIEGTATAATNYAFDISQYERTHQSIYLAMRLNIPIQLQNSMELNDQTSYETEGSYRISLYGSPQSTLGRGGDVCPYGCVSCPEGDEGLGLTCDLLSEDATGGESVACEGGEEWCSWMSLYSVNFVEHKTYYWAIETDNGMDEFIADADPDAFQDWLSEFELAWYYTWAFVTLLVMFLPPRGFFTVALRDDIRWSKWTRLQKWAAVLLVGLFFFNNPFLAAQIYGASPKSTFIWYAVAEGVFVSLLLLFLLDRLFEAGNADNERGTKGAPARGAGVMLALLLCIVYVINMIDIRVSRDGNPDRVHKYPYTSTGTEKILTVLVFVYCCWALPLAGRAWRWGRGREKLRSSPRARFVVLSSFVTLALLLPAIILEYLQPRVRGGAAFTLSHGGVNLYVVALALLCAPTRAKKEATDAKSSSSPSVAGEADDDVIRTTINPMANHRAVDTVQEEEGDEEEEEEEEEDEEGEGEEEQRPRSHIWSRKKPARVQNSTLWEDA